MVLERHVCVGWHTVVSDTFIFVLESWYFFLNLVRKNEVFLKCSYFHWMNHDILCETLLTKWRTFQPYITCQAPLNFFFNEKNFQRLPLTLKNIWWIVFHSYLWTIWIKHELWSWPPCFAIWDSITVSVLVTPPIRILIHVHLWHILSLYDNNKTLLKNMSPFPSN